jgi:hypothetical protein
MITDPCVKVPIILDMVYPQAWLTEKAPDDAECRTNMKVQTAVSLHGLAVVCNGGTGHGTQAAIRHSVQ